MTSEEFIARLGLPSRLVMLDVTPHHETGHIRVIVHDPSAASVPEGCIPTNERLEDFD